MNRQDFKSDRADHAVRQTSGPPLHRWSAFSLRAVCLTFAVMMAAGSLQASEFIPLGQPGDSSSYAYGVSDDGFDDVLLGTEANTPEAYVVFGGANITPPPPPPSFSINDATVIEGDSGTVTAEFTVTRARDASGTDTVDIATANGTASAGSDYTAILTTTLTFAPGVTALPVSVTVIGDTQQEGDETFLVNLTGASPGATITDGQGVGTIQEDDAPFDPNTIYVWDIWDAMETRQRGRNNTDYRLVIDVRQDSDGDGIAEASDAGIAGVAVTVVLTDSAGQSQILTGITDSSGILLAGFSVSSLARLRMISPSTYSLSVAMRRIGLRQTFLSLLTMLLELK